MKQQVAFKIKGMTRDIAVSSFNAEYAFENKNIRFFTLEDNTAACISNEKGNEHIKIKFGEAEADYIAGIPIGNAVIDNKLILFTKDTDKDYIYKIWYEEDVLKGIVLAEQNLGFSVEHPIETLTYYENKDIQKVYWVDGINPPRCINIAEKDTTKWKDNSHYFDFINTLQLKEKVTVEKTFDQGGLFHSGVIQYACTYFNKYGQESNIFYTSPLLYISHQNRGGSPEDIINNAFKITISNPDSNFDYIRIYSIFRSSINNTVEVKKVIDLNKKEGIYSSKISPLTGMNVDFKITDIKVTTATGERYLTDDDAEDGIQVSLNVGLGNYDITCSVISFPDGSWMNVENSAVGLLCKNGRVTNILPQDDTLPIYNIPYEDPFFIDTNTTGEIVDNSILLYIGGEKIIASTITQKDNTLFLGDIEIKRQLLPEEVINHFKHNKAITFSASKELTPPTLEGVYPYNSQLKYDASKIKTFKYLDWYRFGIQFQHETGKWSEPLWIDDVRNDVPIITNPYEDVAPLKLIQASYNLNGGISEVLTEEGYVKARPVVVYPSINDREVVCQGVLCPTVYKYKDRQEGIPYAQSSWFTRPNAPYDYYRTYNCPSTDTVYFRCKEIYNSDNKLNGKDAIGKYILLYQDRIEWALILSQYEDPYTKDTWFICKINSSYKYFFRTPHYGTEEFTVYNSHNTEDPVGFTITLYDFQLLNGIDTRPIYGGESGISRASMLDVGQQLLTYSIDDKTQTGGSLTITPKKESLSPNNLGAYAQYGLESRHGYSLPKNTKGNAELQNASDEGNKYDTTVSSDEMYYVDQSIITLHSPEIEYDSTLHQLDLSQLKLRIVGVVPITGNVRNIKVQTSTAPLAATGGAVGRGFDSGDYATEPGDKVLYHNAWHTLSAVACWDDYLYKADNSSTALDFTIYPWHRDGSLNNTNNSEPNSTKSSLLKHKGISNFKYSYSSKYFNPQNIWKALDDRQNFKDYNTGISGVALFNSDVVSVVKLPPPYDKGNMPEITYYGNIDSIAAPYSEDGYPITFLENLYIGTPTDTPDVGDTFCKIKTGKYNATSNTPKTGLNGIAVKYKSSPHAVLALKYANKTITNSVLGVDYEIPIQRILPTFYDHDGDRWVVNPPKNSTVSQDVIDLIGAGAAYKTSNVARSINCGFLWLGELYRDGVINRFGGTTEDALSKNQWVPCGEAVELNTEGTNIYWTEGDTYYQRYDHLKTLPFHPEDQNSIVDIISFMCETRINIDGRYDRNRGLENYLNVNKENFNKINPIYSQQDNFFSYRSLDRERFDISHFENSIIWTKTKVAGELTDTWTNITMANTLDLDGDKGKITALKRFNDNIIAFQDKGISQILYNEQTQISTTAGVPIEIANSNKVTGRRYVSDRVGCQNKWSICETSQGIYFVDDYNKEIYKFTGELTPLSTSLGFKAWTVQNTKINNIWNPAEFNAITTQYDNKNKDVLFITKDECLAYSELYNTFTSYYSYEGTPYMINLSDKVLSLHKSLASGADSNYRLWCQQEGQYNKYFGKFNPYYISLIANPNPFTDKVFTNVEFRSDTWDSNNQYLANETFDTLIAKNEYQEGEVDFTQSPRELKKKFRIWRANIPRNTTNLGGDNLHNCSRDRMRNPWLYIKLAKQKEQYNRMILHDVVVSYYE